MLTRTLPLLPLLLSASTALAQPVHDPKSPDPLRGPSVTDRNVPGVNGSFGEPGGDKKKFLGETRLPPRIFRDALDTIMSPNATENLRVTDEQRTRYQSWMDDFQKSVGAYMKDHRDELNELRRRGGEPRRPGQNGARPPEGQNKPGNSDEMMKPDGTPPTSADPKETGAARERFQSLMAGAPKIEELYTKIWTELKPDQQKAVDAKLDEFRAQQAKDREENYVRQKTKKKNPDAAKPEVRSGEQPKPGQPQGEQRRRPFAPDNAAAPQGQPSDRAFNIDPQRRERLMRLFSQLSPEQQEQMLARLEKAREQNGGELPNPKQLRRGKGGPQGTGEPRPAPQPDDSMMPPPPPPAPSDPQRQP